MRGYEFEIIKGYKFKSEIIFKEYVDKMYKLRLQYSKDNPMNLIAKLLMNSLYGKFVMKPETTLVEIFDKNSDEGRNLLRSKLDTFGESIQDCVELDDHVIISRANLVNYKCDESNDMYLGMDVNIGIASAITSSGRMYMSYVKNSYKYKIYYSDTDSIIISSPLSKELTGTELGKFKLECEITRAVFLAPKVYGFITTDNKEVIKVKGVTKEALKDVHVADLETLLIKDSRMVFN